MGAMASQITSLAVVYSIVYSGPDQSKHQSSVSLAFVRGIHRWPVNSPHKGPVTRKMFPFDDVIMLALLVYRWANIGPREFCSDIYMRHLCYMDTSKSYPISTFKNNWNNFLCEFENQSLTWYWFILLSQAVYLLTIKDRCLSGTKPLSETLFAYFRWDFRENISR